MERLIETEDGRVVVIPPDDVQWIVERMYTSSSGKVLFYSSAMALFRKITDQRNVPPWRLRAQMLRAFRRLA